MSLSETIQEDSEWMAKWMNKINVFQLNVLNFWQLIQLILYVWMQYK